MGRVPTEAPRALGPFARVIDADARCCEHTAGGSSVIDQVKRGWFKRNATQRPVDFQCAAHQGGAIGTLKARTGLHCPHQNRMWTARRPRDEVQAMVHAVDEVHISVAGSSVHHLGTRRSAPAGRMSSEVFGAQVCLDLNKTAPPQLPSNLAHQDFAEKVTRHL